MRIFMCTCLPCTGMPLIISIRKNGGLCMAVVAIQTRCQYYIHNYNWMLRYMHTEWTHSEYCIIMYTVSYSTALSAHMESIALPKISAPSEPNLFQLRSRCWRHVLCLSDDDSSVIPSARMPHNPRSRWVRVVFSIRAWAVGKREGKINVQYLLETTWESILVNTISSWSGGSGSVYVHVLTMHRYVPDNQN